MLALEIFLVKSFRYFSFTEVGVFLEQWAQLSLAVFRVKDRNYLKWLRVIWSEDRQRIQTEVLQTDSPALIAHGNFVCHTIKEL